MGKAAIYSVAGEDDFAKLEDEIYKTVTFLEQTKDTAVQARNDFARNLSQYCPPNQDADYGNVSVCADDGWCLRGGSRTLRRTAAEGI